MLGAEWAGGRFLWVQKRYDDGSGKINSVECAFSSIPAGSANLGILHIHRWGRVRCSQVKRMHINIYIYIHTYIRMHRIFSLGKRVSSFLAGGERFCPRLSWPSFWGWEPLFLLLFESHWWLHRLLKWAKSRLSFGITIDTWMQSRDLQRFHRILLVFSV